MKFHLDYNEYLKRYSRRISARYSFLERNNVSQECGFRTR